MPTRLPRFAAELLHLSVQHGSAVGRANAALLGGWARIVHGQHATGLNEVEEGLRLWRQTKSRFHVPRRLATVAEFFVAAGQPQMAWQLIDEAFEAAEQIGEPFFLSELYRLKGELLLVLHGDRQDHAAGCFEQALTIARSQEARLLELRAATSLSRLWHQRDRRGEARGLLAPICGWFTEGFDLPDLQAAKGLLDALGT